MCRKSKKNLRSNQIKYAAIIVRVHVPTQEQPCQKMDAATYEVQPMYQSDYSLYLKIGMVAIVATLIAAGVVYFVKPNAFLKIKNDKSSGLDLGLVTLMCAGIFAVTFGGAYLLYRTSWGNSGSESPMMAQVHAAQPSSSLA